MQKVHNVNFKHTNNQPNGIFSDLFVIIHNTYISGLLHTRYMQKKTIQVDQQKLHSSTFMCRLQGLSLTNDFHMILLAHYLTLPF